MPLGGAKDEHFSCFHSLCQWGLSYELEVPIEFVTGGVELLKAVLHGYVGGLIFMK